jgi:hypothetical protein
VHYDCAPASQPGQQASGCEQTRPARRAVRPTGSRPGRPGFSAPDIDRAPYAEHFEPETTMKQHHPGQDGSGGHAGASSWITRQDLMCKARHLANRHPPRADLITPGDPGYDEAPQSRSQRC